MPEMLPTPYTRSLRDLLSDLETFASALANATPADTDLAERGRSLHGQFQQVILPLPAEALPSGLASAWQTLQTELHRNLRLLQTELMFLQAARQPQTRQQRLQTCQARVQGAIAQARSLLEA